MRRDSGASYSDDPLPLDDAGWCVLRGVEPLRACVDVLELLPCFLNIFQDLHGNFS